MTDDSDESSSLAKLPDVTNSILTIGNIEVTTPGGTTLRLQTPQEAGWYTDRRDLYLKQYQIEDVSDLQEMERLLVMEVMVQRWSVWLAQGYDYVQDAVDEGYLQTIIRQYSAEIRRLKSSLGIDRVTRAAEKTSGGVAEYIDNLLRRAQEMGIQRNKEYDFAVTSLWELISMVQTYDRCDAEERVDLGLDPEAVLDFVRREVIPKWDKLINSFRATQKMWIEEI